MRNYNGNGILAEYPDKVVWIQDSNVVNVHAADPGGKVGAEITVRHPGGVETRRIRYMGELSQLLFVLDDALAALHDYNIGQYTCQVDLYLDGVQVDSFSFNFQLLDGKSFTNRSHAISRTIYIYDLDELAKLQIYSPETGIFAVTGGTFILREGLNQYNLTSNITANGEYSACLQSGYQLPVAQITGDTPERPWLHDLYWTVTGDGTQPTKFDGGDVWWKGEVFPICHTIVVDDSCSGDDFVELRYRDADGCERYLGGRLVKEVNKAETQSYTRTETTNAFRNIPRRRISGTSRAVTVGFSDIATDAYPQDIRYSEEVYMRMYDGEWWPVVVASDSITTKGSQDTQDFELEIIISEE